MCVCVGSSAIAYTTRTYLPTADMSLSLNSIFRLALFIFYHLVHDDDDEKKAHEIKPNENNSGKENEIKAEFK